MSRCFPKGRTCCIWSCKATKNYTIYWGLKIGIMRIETIKLRMMLLKQLFNRSVISFVNTTI